MPDRLEFQTASKKINQELFSLTPSTLITMFQIDISSLVFNKGITHNNLDQVRGLGEDFIFRFHNTQKLLNTNIYWQGQTYVAAPIFSEGWEYNGKGTLPTPKLSLTVSDEGISLLAAFKDKLKQIGDLTGAVVTRIRTFSKFLDVNNFIENGLKVPEEGYEPDPLAELPRDIFYIDRKSNETKNTIEFELAAIWDIENIKLPGRLVVATKCGADYRGEGCLYENRSLRIEKIHGKDGYAEMPFNAPPVATENDELISTILKQLNNNVDVPLISQGLYNSSTNYNMGDYVYINRVNKDGEQITPNYYFVSKINNPPSGPPDSRYWIGDNCSKTIKGCRLRFGQDGSVVLDTQNTKIVRGNLPFGGFPATNKLAQ